MPTSSRAATAYVAATVNVNVLFHSATYLRHIKKVITKSDI